MIAHDGEHPLTRERIEMLASVSTAHSVDAIRSAVEAADYEDACARALARVRAGHSLPAPVAAQILPGLEAIGLMVHLIAVSSGDRAAALLEAVERQRFRDSWFGDDQAAVALFAAWRLGDGTPIRRRVVAQVRLLARRQPSSAGAGLLVTLADQIADRDLAADAIWPRPVARDDAAGLAEMIWAELHAPLHRVLARVGEFKTSRRRTIRVTRQGGERPGRNEPCPCGSSVKYKRCCASRPDARTASPPTTEVAWSQFLAEFSDQLTADHVNTLGLRDLARVDHDKLSDNALFSAVSRFSRFRRWDLAIRCLDIGSHRGGIVPVEVDQRRAMIGVAALRCGQVDVARSQLKAMRYPEAFTAGQMALAIVDHELEALDRLLREADAVAVEPTGSVATMFTVMLLMAAPGLGLLVAKGFGGETEPDALLRDAVAEARIRLHLPSEEPGSGQERPQKARGAPQTSPPPGGQGREGTDPGAAATARLEERERQVQEREAELTRARIATTPTPLEDDERRSLREKVASLKALLRERNDERADLRRQLAEATAAAATRTVDSAGPPVDDLDAAEAEDLVVVPGGRQVLLPRFTPQATAALRRVPVHVAAAVVREVGELGAGDLAAWRIIKQAKGMSDPVLMARIGIHHRLVFRVAAGEMIVLDVVTRENLLSTLKQMV